MTISSVVPGFTPRLSALSLTSKIPNPGTLTTSPFNNASPITAKVSSKTLPVSFTLKSNFSA